MKTLKIISSILLAGISILLASQLLIQTEDHKLYNRVEWKIIKQNNPRRSQNHKNQRGHVTCVPPQLNLWHPDLKQYFVDVPPLKCAPEDNWVYIEDGHFKISNDAKQKHGHVTCDYTPYIRGNDDFTVLKGKSIKDMKDGTPLMEDFFAVTCTSKDGNTYKSIHSGIAHKGYQHKRPVQIPSEALGLNILVFGFDSMSRMTWMRNLPRSHDFFINNLGATILEGYNIVGDGTTHALLPMLTGKTQPELPEARRIKPNAKPVDDFPWIWRNLTKLGYVTQYAEDMSNLNAFSNRILGFKEKPVDHYMRPFFMEAEKQYDQHKPFCLGSIPRHVNMLNWASELYNMYPNQPKFSFFLHGELSHDFNSAVRVADEDLKQFLQNMDKLGHLNNTLLILMGDHGARYTEARQTSQGKYEERMPYFGLRLPDWVKEKYPSIIKNLKINAHRLISPFDIHETFIQVVFGVRDKDLHGRGLSVFKEIPEERTCAEADIDPHWCACLDWQPIQPSDQSIHPVGQVLLQTINNITRQYSSQCKLLEIFKITAAAKYTPSQEWSDIEPNDKNDKDTYSVLYQISIITTPGLARYETTLKYNVKTDKYKINEKDISRTNKYGKQPHCVMERFPHLRPYCYCTDQIS